MLEPNKKFEVIYKTKGWYENTIHVFAQTAELAVAYCKDTGVGFNGYPHGLPGNDYFRQATAILGTG